MAAGHSHRIGYIPQLLIKEIPSLGSRVYLHMPLPALAKVLEKDFRHTLFTGSEITTIKNRAYFINQNQELRQIAGGEELIEWYLETGDLEESLLNRKYIGKIQFLLELERGSRVEIFLKHDSDAAFRRMLTVYATRKRTYTIPIKPMRCFHYRWRLEGKGKARLIAVGKYIEEGSEI